MGMEQRGNNTYYYRKRWERGTCVSEYLGNGYTAQLLAACEQARRAEEAAERAAVKREQRTIKEQAALVLSTEADVRDLVKAVLLANGFHQHKRQWRKRMQQETLSSPTAAPLAPGDTDPEAERRREGLRALREALGIQAQPAKKGGKVTELARAEAERDKCEAVRKVLAAYPCIWDRVQYTLSTAQRTVIESATGTAQGSAPAQLLEKSMHAMRTKLGFEAAPPLEQLLIEQVVLAWFDLNFVTMRYAAASYGSHELTSGTYWDRRINSAQARYLRATEALARVRRLAMPQALQVNIGGQHVNMAGVSVGQA